MASRNYSRIGSRFVKRTYRYIFILLLDTALTTAFAAAFVPRAFGQSSNYDKLVTQAKSELSAGQNDEALTDSKKAIAVQSKRWEAYMIAGYVLQSEKRYDEAIDEFSHALEYSPADKKDDAKKFLEACKKAKMARPTVSATARGTTAPESTAQSQDQNQTTSKGLVSYFSGSWAYMNESHRTFHSGQCEADNTFTDEIAFEGLEGQVANGKRLVQGEGTITRDDTRNSECEAVNFGQPADVSVFCGESQCTVSYNFEPCIGDCTSQTTVRGRGVQKCTVYAADMHDDWFFDSCGGNTRVYRKSP